MRYTNPRLLYFTLLCCVLSTDVRRNCVRRFSDSQHINDDAKQQCIFCGRYGYSFWPILSFHRVMLINDSNARKLDKKYRRRQR